MGNEWNENEWNDNEYGWNQEVTQEAYRSPLDAVTKSVSGVLTGAFFYMFIALLITGITAVVVASSPVVFMAIFSNTASIFLIFGLEFAVVFGAQAAMRKNNVVLSAILFLAYAIINGLTFSVIFLAYTASSIEQAFFVTAVMFGIMALVGKVTKRDLSSLGSILMVGLISVIVVSLVNIFIGSSMIDTLVSIVAVVIFLGLTAYDVQKIEKMAAANYGYGVAVLSLWGAMELYLDFINLFLRIIRLMGRRK